MEEPATLMALLAHLGAPLLLIHLQGDDGTALIFLLDELGEGVFLAFFLWGAVLVCRYAACVLQSKAELLARPREAAAEPAADTAPAE